MEVGTGIAFLAAWMPLCAALLAKEVRNPGVVWTIIIGISVTTVAVILNQK